VTALTLAGYFLFSIERQIGTRRQEVRVFDLHTRQVAIALGDVRAAQQAYVAAGQGGTTWIPKVAALQTEIARGIDTLRATAVSPEARSLLMQAAAAVTEFGNIDRRAREYLEADQTLMTGDIVFSEGAESATATGRLLESARAAEDQTHDASESALRQRQAMMAGAATALAAAILLLLGLTPVGAPETAASVPERLEATPATGDLMLRQPVSAPRVQSEPAAAAGQAAVSRGSVPMLKATAELCTEFGRVKDPADLPRLLARAADVMDATGIVVWLGSTAGADLRPVLAHGYPEHVLARLPKVPRAADNAAAMAYRTGELQIVLRRPGNSNGAVVAPLLAPDGCVGALSAEILAGSESTDGVQAVAALIAAQLTGVVAPSLAVEAPDVRISSSR
jgi:hypothetical protein